MSWINHLSCRRAERYLWVGLTSPRGVIPTRSPWHPRLVASPLTGPWRMAWENPRCPSLWGCSSDGAGPGAGAGPGHHRWCEPPHSPPALGGVSLGSGRSLACRMEEHMGLSPFDFLKEKNCTLTQSNLGILKLQAQNAHKSGNEGIRAACPAGSGGFVPLCFPHCIPPDARCTLLAGSTVAPGHAVPAGCPARLICWRRHGSRKRRSL